MSSPRRYFLQLHFVPPFHDAPALRSHIEAIFDGDLQGADKIASSRYAKVFRFEAEIKGEARAFYYKEFLFRNFRDRLSVLFRPSRAMRAWRGSRLLIDHGFDTAPPVCVGEDRRFGVVRRNLMITESIPDVLELADYPDHEPATQEHGAVSRKRRFLKEYGRVIGRLHREGIFQGDLRERNILVRNGDPPKFYLIDNERTRRYRNLPDRKRLKNLVQANMYPFTGITRTDRVRFFCAYLEENPSLIPRKKVWMKNILRKTRFRLRKKGRL